MKLININFQIFQYPLLLCSSLFDEDSIQQAPLLKIPCILPDQLMKDVIVLMYHRGIFKRIMVDRKEMLSRRVQLFMANESSEALSR